MNTAVGGAIRVARRPKAVDVVDVLSDLFILRGVPEHVRSDNAPEFIAKAVKDSIEDRIRERNEACILKAATRLFSRKGFDGTRIAEIAEGSDLPKANVYYYFSSKEEIYNAIIQRLLTSWDDALEHIRIDREPREALEAHVRAKLDQSQRNSEESRLFANEILGGGKFLKRKDRQHMREVTRAHAEVVEAWIAAGKMRPVDPRHLFIQLWSTTQFYADFEMLVCDALDVSRLTKADFDTAARTICATVLQSLFAPEPPPSERSDP